MIKFFKHFFSYVPSESPYDMPEVPKEEPSDPNENRALTDSVRTARRNLVILCGLCIAWSSAQFALHEPKIDIAGVSLDFKIASIPVVLAIVLIYLTIRWGMEFAMMPRHIRRWPLAQLDFRLLLMIVRFALLALAAGVLDRSLWTILLVIISMGLLVVGSIILSILLMFITMPVRIWARSRAGVESVARAALEAIFWAGLFAIFIALLSIIGLGIASYYYTPFRDMIEVWMELPDPIALSIFIATLIGVFLSHWLLNPVIKRIFAERPGYYTERDADDNLIFHIPFGKDKEPLL